MLVALKCKNSTSKLCLPIPLTELTPQGNVQNGSDEGFNIYIQIYFQEQQEKKIKDPIEF